MTGKAAALLTRLPVVRWTWARRAAVFDVIVAAVTTGVEIGLLVAGYRTAGLPVELRIHEEARAPAGGVELSVYRIVEEALTNVLKHSRPTTVTVALR